MYETFLQTFSLTHQDAAMIPVGIALFLLFLAISSRLVFSPLTKLVEERESSSFGVTDRAQTVFDEAAKLTESVERAISQALLSGMKQKVEQLSLTAREAESTILDAARQADAIVEKGRHDQNDYAKRLRESAEASVATLAEEAARKILTVASL